MKIRSKLLLLLTFTSIPIYAQDTNKEILVSAGTIFGKTVKCDIPFDSSVWNKIKSSAIEASGLEQEKATEILLSSQIKSQTKSIESSQTNCEDMKNQYEILKLLVGI